MMKLGEDLLGPDEELDGELATGAIEQLELIGVNQGRPCREGVGRSVVQGRGRVGEAVGDRGRRRRRRTDRATAACHWLQHDGLDHRRVEVRHQVAGAAPHPEDSLQGGTSAKVAVWFMPRAVR